MTEEGDWLKIEHRVRITVGGIGAVGQVGEEFEASHGRWVGRAASKSAKLLLKEEVALLTLTTKGSVRRSSIVLPSRLRFLPPCSPPSLKLREVSDSGVKILPV